MCGWFDAEWDVILRRSVERLMAAGRLIVEEDESLPDLAVRSRGAQPVAAGRCSARASSSSRAKCL